MCGEGALLLGNACLRRLESRLKCHGALHQQVQRVGLASTLLQDECFGGEVLIGDT